ncbi:MAG: pyridoxal-phosphate dependent enzyme [Deltaproteobacteria bacterium]|nr:pyridoxal-phosphate dependent enzyme [Deltaproteobacteria bacterium]MBI3295381.1 pyridoxal-phosphate dependent enzyme [Deltaproteobacteria bacterium]
MLDQLIHRTPLIPFRGDSQILLKAENLQPLGSYKIRGVANVMRKNALQLRSGISAASAGNMAQALALGATTLQVPCRIYLPDTAPEVKKQAIRDLGAELTELPYTEVWKLVNLEAEPPSNTFFVHPALCEDLTEGYGQIAAEILEEQPDVQAVVVPFGVGGLLLGIARALRRLGSGAKIYAVEPETASPLFHSLKNGRPTKIQRRPSFIDAIGTPEVIRPVFDEVRGIVKDSIVVTLEETRTALKTLLLSHKLLCEGSAAAALAAGLRLRKKGHDHLIACILTGGNIAPDVLKELI